ncbi:MAG: metallophosphoesterase [Clostridia bacterium]|nr:metallophosphoesterase [Clostridia bacterium]
MFKLYKKKDKDFLILNLTDVHTEDNELYEDSVKKRVLVNTVTEVVNRVRPDLITLSGDQAWAGHFKAIEFLSELMESFNIPWTLVWGNHDHDRGDEVLDKTAEIFMRGRNFIYEHGPVELGKGNFVIGICEDDKIVEGLILMDTHNRIPFINKDGKEDCGWGKLYANQIQWYKEQVCNLTDLGCKDTTIIIHQPIYAYRYAISSALKEGINPKSVSVENSYKGDIWKDGYKDSFGINHEDVCCHLVDDGFFDTVTELGSTKTVIAGHDHVNYSCIPYKGVRLTYGLKTGMGAYWRPELNGGTVLTVSSDGITDIRHEFVDATDWTK